MHRRSRKDAVILAFLSTLAAPVCLAQSRVTHNPEEARLVTSDIADFWRAFYKASLQNAADLFQREYIDPGSAGLHDFLKSRIGNGQALAATVNAHARYYAAIRESTLAIDRNPRIKQSIRDGFVHLKELYPDAVFPDVYFLIGQIADLPNVVAHENETPSTNKRPALITVCISRRCARKYAVHGQRLHRV